MADWPLQQAPHIPSLLAFLDESEDGIQCFEEFLEDFRRMVDANIDAVPSKVSLGHHFLGDECLVGQGMGRVKSESRQGRKAPVTDSQAMSVSQLLPALADL